MKKVNLSPILKIILFAIISFTLISQIIFAESINERYEFKLRKLVQNGGYIVTKENSHMLSYNKDKQFIPASIWKLVTAIASLETLGEKYHFKTEFYLDSQNNLFIKGFGDPFLISEEVDLIFKELADRGIVEINNIYLDSTSFNLPEPPPGVSSSLNPYDVTNGALAVNFNTINFYIDDNGSIRSAEKQTPTLLIMKDLGRGFSRGKHRINMSKSANNVLRHTGELFRAFQNHHKISGKGSQINKKTPENLTPFYVHYSSKTLTDVIKAMMLYSNNYIANQIYLTMGANEYGYPATWEKGKKYLEHYLNTNFSKYSDEIKVREGSGISRDNRITTRAFLAVLERYRPYMHTLPLDKGRYIKSGTLKGVYSYAGYLKGKDAYNSFVIILNQQKNNRNRVLDILERAYKGTL